MRTLVIDHPLVTHKLTALRDSATDTATFRSLTAELVALLAYEATREIRVQPVSVTTPVGVANGVKLARPVPLIVPVLRAGIGMLDGMTRLLPMADVGFVGLRRDEESLVASTYADRLPADLTGRDTFVLDPMLATGGTLATVIGMLTGRGAASVTAICLLAAPEGLRHVEAGFAGDADDQAGAGRAAPRVRVVTAAVDERLNDRGYILPGLGDAGDRLFGMILEPDRGSGSLHREVTVVLPCTVTVRGPFTPHMTRKLGFRWARGNPAFESHGRATQGARFLKPVW